MTQHHVPDFHVKLAHTDAERQAAQRLRYDVFVSELGGGGDMVDHAQQLERDAFDDFVDHLLLIDRQSDTVVGVYRLMRPEMAERAGGYYTAAEYDLAVLQGSGRRLLELGRSCVHPRYRGGMAMHYLWQALAEYVAAHKIEVLFGVASFHGTDIGALAAPLSLLHHRHLAEPELRPMAHKKSFQNMNLMDEIDLDRIKVMQQMPSLIKAYLRLGGRVGEGAFVDHAFNTTDVCLVLDTEQLSQRQARIYLQGSK